MRIAIITTDYAPLRSSAAVQLRDLAQEFGRQGKECVIFVPAESLRCSWKVETLEGSQVVRLAAPRMKGAGHLRRAIAEAWMPFAMLYGIWRSSFRLDGWDAIIWYSPSIFFGPLVAVMKRRSKCPTYLILRDIFPEWARDLGLLKSGPIYYFLKCVARYQYSIADSIGVQTPSNLAYLQDWSKTPGRRLEVLQNWLTPAPFGSSTIQIAETNLVGRRICIYAGNMGVAQGADMLVELAASLRFRQDLGFVFVGRGTEASRLRAEAIGQGLDNVVFKDEVDSSEMPGLLSQCHVGLIALDSRHKTHNIPGKFLTYMQAGLPVLAKINPGTDLAVIIENEAVGRAYTGTSIGELRDIAIGLIDNQEERKLMSIRGRALSERMFSTETAVRQILTALFGLASPLSKPD